MAVLHKIFPCIFTSSVLFLEQTILSDADSIIVANKNTY